MIFMFLYVRNVLWKQALFSEVLLPMKLKWSTLKRISGNTNAAIFFIRKETGSADFIASTAGSSRFTRQGLTARNR